MCMVLIIYQFLSPSQAHFDWHHDMMQYLVHEASCFTHLHSMHSQSPLHVCISIMLQRIQYNLGWNWYKRIGPNSHIIYVNLYPDLFIRIQLPWRTRLNICIHVQASLYQWHKLDILFCFVFFSHTCSRIHNPHEAILSSGYTYISSNKLIALWPHISCLVICSCSDWIMNSMPSPLSSETWPDCGHQVHHKEEPGQVSEPA